MSLRCSLLGHEYGDSEIERDRQERGNEVVISVVQLERCRRCGHTRTITENTEVTQRSPRNPPGSAGADAGTVAGPGAAEPTDTGTGSANEPVGLGGTSASTFPSDSDDAEIVEPEATAADTGGAEDEADEGPIDWPDHGESGADARTEPETGIGDGAGTRAWPTVEGDDEGFDATVPDGERADVEFGGGLTPRRAEGGAEILDTGSEPDRNDGGADTEFVHPEASITPGEPADDSGDATLYCPGCDASNLDHRHSLRAGDICPICHRGYLAEKR